MALIGDAAYCPSLFTGYGSHLAMVGAYILAGELKKASGDYHSAFQKYEDEFGPFVEQNKRIRSDTRWSLDQLLGYGYEIGC